MGKHHIAAAVPRLIVVGCPAAVSQIAVRLAIGTTPTIVMSVVVDSFERESALRPGSEFAEKSLEVVPQPLANSDSAAAIVCVSSVARIEAALLQVYPRFVFRWIGLPGCPG